MTNLLSAEELLRLWRIGSLGEVMPGNENVIILIFTSWHKNVPVAIVGRKFVEVLGAVDGAHPVSVDVHTIGGVCTSVAQQVRIFASRIENEPNSIALCLGNLVSAPFLLDGCHRGRRVGGTPCLVRRPRGSFLLPVRITGRANSSSRAQPRAHRACPRTHRRPVDHPRIEPAISLSVAPDCGMSDLLFRGGVVG